MPYVSVIMPAYNAANFILKALRSVQAQSFSDWEVIVVDDASNDNTVEVVQKMQQQDGRIKLIVLESNSGAAVARNTAIEQARGKYIAFLDCDDIWYSDKLAKQIDFMQREHCDFCYAAFDRRTEDGKYLVTTHVPLDLDYNALLKNTTIGCLTVIYDAKKLGKIYTPLISKCEDYALWLKVLKRADCAKGINEPLGSYTVRANSISANKLLVAKFTWKVLYQLEKLPLWKASYYFFLYTKRGLGIAFRSKLNVLLRRGN